MSAPSAPPLVQCRIEGDFEALKSFSAALDAWEEPAWLALSVFETQLPAGRLDLLFTDKKSAADFVQNTPMDAAFNAHIETLAQENWVEKSLEGLPPVRAGRFFMHGAHHHPPADPRTIPILVEAGEAFGTGHHGTTKGCLLAYEDVLKSAPPHSVLDLGTGAGTLAIAAAKTLNVPIVATDIDPVAVRVAAQNATANDVATQINFICADGCAHEALYDQTFDLVFANILAGPLIDMASDIAARVASGGQLVLSGLLDTQEDKVQSAYEAQGLSQIQHYALDEWRVLRMKKPG